VEYRLTKMGLSLSDAFCGVWRWAGRHLAEIEQARREFDAKAVR
jgi:DNA-binding HxlR family transcriptional regulator